MIRLISIKDLVLVEEATIPFQEGFNVMTGETGAGKSAIMHALGLIAGQKSDMQLLRSGAEKGSVEVVFEIEALSNLMQLLEDSGLEHEKGCELIIRREISNQGRSRVFINHQVVQLALLKRICHHLFEIIGQHANQSLLSAPYHREVVDAFGGLQEQVEAFSLGFAQEKRLKEELTTLRSEESERLRDQARIEAELDEIDEAHLDGEEEEQLFGEYKKLSHSDELIQAAMALQQIVSNEGALGKLAQGQQWVDQLLTLDPEMQEMGTIYRSATLELNEFGNHIERYVGGIEVNPARMAVIDERLSLINRLKRKYGVTIEAIVDYRSEIEEKLSALTHADAQIEQLEKEISEIEKENEKAAVNLTAVRKKHAKLFASLMLKQLHSLKMEQAEFEVRMSKQGRSDLGDDHVEFYLKPNVGESWIPLKECASGGELSRILLALQVLLAGKKQTPTLIFDEIDANIGGETATEVGKTLQTIGKKHQVICITHFPQVAKQAEHHLRIAKFERDQRTHTFVMALNVNERKQELARMRG